MEPRGSARRRGPEERTGRTPKTDRGTGGLSESETREYKVVEPVPSRVTPEYGGTYVGTRPVPTPVSLEDIVSVGRLGTGYT